MNSVKADARFAYNTSLNLTTINDKVFYKSNENVADLINYFDFKDKNILTVAGSGDQIFHFLNSNASSVDAYDKNVLTKYYYYFRVWCIRYLNKFYPPSGFDKDFIKQLLLIVEPLNKNEIEAYSFWSEYINLLNNNEINFIRYGTFAYENTIMNLSRIKEKNKCGPIDFKIFDLTEEINVNKKYDIVYVSNIREWIWLMDPKNRIKYKDNLYNLLNEDGIVICSTLDHYTVGLDEENSIFRDQFLIQYIDGRKNADREVYRQSPGYYYKKR